MELELQTLVESNLRFFKPVGTDVNALLKEPWIKTLIEEWLSIRKSTNNITTNSITKEISEFLNLKSGDDSTHLIESDVYTKNYKNAQKKLYNEENPKKDIKNVYIKYDNGPLTLRKYKKLEHVVIRIDFPRNVLREKYGGIKKACEEGIQGILWSIILPPPDKVQVAYNIVHIDNKTVNVICFVMIKDHNYKFKIEDRVQRPYTLYEKSLLIYIQKQVRKSMYDPHYKMCQSIMYKKYATI